MLGAAPHSPLQDGADIRPQLVVNSLTTHALEFPMFQARGLPLTSPQVSLIWPI